MPVFLILIFICLVLSFFSWERPLIKKLLPVFFTSLLIIESVCYYLAAKDKNTMIIYNLWFPLEFSFYSYWIASYLNNHKFKRTILLLIPIYLGICGLIYVQASTLYKFNTLAFQLGIILLIPVLLYKLYEFINEAVIINPFKNAVFWLISGLLVSSLGSFLKFSGENYLLTNYKDLLLV
jgi:hypothetical protein